MILRGKSPSLVDWRFSTGGLTIQVHTEIPGNRQTFNAKVLQFLATNDDDENTIVLHHHFRFPQLPEKWSAPPVYRRVPWLVQQQANEYWYIGIDNDNHDLSEARSISVFNRDHTRGDIYYKSEETFRKGGLLSISHMTTDQIFLSRILSDHQGFILHSAGMILSGCGFAFAGHSGAGKSTITSQLRAAGEILCDDRNILRRHPDGWRIYGTWSHGDIPDVSPNSAPLRAVLLLEQAPFNRLIPLTDRREIVRRLPFIIVKPLVDAGWWEKTLDLVGHIAREVPVYRLQFDRSGRVLDALRELL